VYFSRRYNIPAHAPVLVRTAIERSGLEAPVWVLRWEGWSLISPVERAFESVNFGLRRVKQPAPLYATPQERAGELAKILPHLAPLIKVLLDEHQTSLYTSRTADEPKARRAAYELRLQVLLSLARRVFTGQYEPQTDT
jgi:hypothetical protein